MPRFACRNSSKIRLALCLAAIVTLCGLPASAWAQGNKKKGAGDGEKKTGTVAGVEKKGKAATITIEEADGEKFDVLVNAKTNFVVLGKGDISYFKHGPLFVSSERVVRNTANGYMHGKEFKVYIGGKGPGEHFEQDELANEVYKIGGAVVDADDESFTFDAGGEVHKVAFDSAGVDVSFESTEPEHAALGSKIEVEGTTRAGKFHPSAITVTLEQPLPASEAFSGSERKPGKTKGGAGKTAPKKAVVKTDKGDGDKTAEKDKGDAAGDKGKADPFGVLDDGKSKKDTKKPKAPAPKKDKKPVDDGDSN